MTPTKKQKDLFFPLVCPRCRKPVFLVNTEIEKKVVIEDLQDTESIHHCAHIGGNEFFGNEEVTKLLNCRWGDDTIPFKPTGVRTESNKKPLTGVVLSIEPAADSKKLLVYSDQHQKINLNYSGKQELSAGMWISFKKAVRQKENQYRATNLEQLSLPIEVFSLVPDISDQYNIIFTSNENEVLERHITRILKVIKRKNGKIAALIPLKQKKLENEVLFRIQVSLYPHISIMEIFNEIPLPPNISFEIQQSKVS